MDNIKTELKEFLSLSDLNLDENSKIKDILNTYNSSDEKTIKDAINKLSLLGRGCNLPLDIQLIGTWTGHLDELVYENEDITDEISTGISVKDLPDDIIYFLATIECDGEYEEDVDIATEDIWSGASILTFGRSFLEGKILAVSSLSYMHVIRPQSWNILTGTWTAQTSAKIKDNAAEIIILRTVGKWYAKRFMSGNYTINVYGLKLGNF